MGMMESNRRWSDDDVCADCPGWLEGQGEENTEGRRLEETGRRGERTASEWMTLKTNTRREAM